jgi:putative endonuclease
LDSTYCECTYGLEFLPFRPLTINQYFLKEGGKKMPGYVYIVRCRDGTFYTGWTNDLEKRLNAHNEGRGGRYTRARRPVALVYSEVLPSKNEAMSREWAIKKMTRAAKQRLADGSSQSAGDFTP